MDKALQDKISRQVVRSFPEMKGSRPSVKRQGAARFLLVYKSKAELPNGRTMNRIVRVVADDRGGIIKMSTSR
ncbi:MAG TPA: hypothetical protein VGA52_15405 [Anaerolineales bacterium]|jgi:hypothetical protein